MYSLIIPPEIITELYHISRKTGKSIRSQIIDSIKRDISGFKELENNSFIGADKLTKLNGGEKNGTACKNI